MTEVSRLILFTETEGQQRKETTIHVEDIGEFIRWWVSSPPMEMKLEVPGEFDNIDLPRQMENKVPEVTAS
ncbi:MAG TPA: hypothetical protein VMS89_00675 [Methanoregulaceae archaeon]|nr:hypothetical protein [Methanoregulaceae archaeon]